jgi:hypothetical protein
MFSFAINERHVRNTEVRISLIFAAVTFSHFAVHIGSRSKMTLPILARQISRHTN